ncbi:hypothetical protein KBA63_03315 [Candidatus Woesebacteria bacterium]|jgi:hypothetical protein|nr:hypothetical protein [Candidatus Woesebacteria bacterium]
MFEKIRVVPLALKYWAFFLSTMLSITLVFVAFIFVPGSFRAPIPLVIFGFVLIYVVMVVVHLYLIGRGVLLKREKREIEYPTVENFRIRFPARYNLFSKRYVDAFKRCCPFCGELIRVDSQWREHSFDTETGKANSYFLEVTCGKDHFRHTLVATKGEKEAMA